MSDRPTPETDALILSKNGFGATNYEWREHSRKLERERDEARNKMADASQEVDLRNLDFERMKQERDEARVELANLESLMFGGLVQPAPKNALAWRVFDAVMAMKKERDEALSQIYQAEDRAARFCQERDEARELVKTYKDYAQLLGDEISDTAALAYVHGWRSKRHEQCKLLQDKIKQLEGAK